MLLVTFLYISISGLSGGFVFDATLGRPEIKSFSFECCSGFEWSKPC